MKKILFLRTDWAANAYKLEHDTYGGIGYYRIVKPAQTVENEYEVTVIGKGYDGLGKTLEERMVKIFTTYDLIVTKPIESPQLSSAFLACSQHFKKPLLLDLDDNLMNVKADNPHYEDHKFGSQNEIFKRTFASLASGLIVSTEPLKKSYASVNKNIDVLPNFNDVEDWPLKPTRYDDGLVRIGWAGSTTHDTDLLSIISPLKKIFRKYPNVHFEVVGGVELEGPFKESFGGFRDRVHAYGGSAAWDGYNKVLANQQWDIAIAPLVNDEFTRCKSHIKWMEYSMMGWPVIASKTYPYYRKILGLPTIEHGKTGMIAKDEKEWFKHLCYLIENPAMRDELARNAYKVISEKWQWKQNVHRYKEVFDKYLKR